MNDILSAPCEIAIEITGRCNLDCKYCFKDNCDKDIPLKELKKILNQIDDMNVFEVCFSGGEPFLHPNILDIFDYCNYKKFNISIVTNGTLFNKKIIKEIDERDLIDVMQISIDSHLESIHDKIRGRHRTTITNLHLIKQYCNVLPMIGIVIHKQNYDSICETLRILEPLCNQFHLMNIMATEKSLQYKDLLYLTPDEIANTWKQIKKCSKSNGINVDIDNHDLKKKETARFTGCTAGKTKIVITPELNIIPCDMTRNLIIGNLKNQTLKDIWNDNKINIVRNYEIEPCYQLNEEWYNHEQMSR